mgnify:CR=1 FL=1
MSFFEEYQNLSSVERKTRLIAVKELKKKTLVMSTDDFSSFCVGLFNFYWYSDGAVEQNEDAVIITNFIDLMSPTSKMKFSIELLVTISKLWEEIDRHRVDKYLALIREITTTVYKFLISLSTLSEWTKWNCLLSDELLFELRSGTVVQQFIFVLQDIVPLLGHSVSASRLFLLIKPAFELHAFTQSKNLKSVVNEEILEKLLRFAGHCSDVHKFAKYIFDFSKDSSVPNNSRDLFYKVVEKLESLPYSAITINTDKITMESKNEKNISENESSKSKKDNNQSENKDKTQKDLNENKNNKSNEKVEKSTSHPDAEKTSSLNNDLDNNKNLTKDNKSIFLNSNDIEEFLTVEEIELLNEQGITVDEYFEMLNNEIEGGYELTNSNESDSDDEPIEDIYELSIEEQRKRLPPYMFLKKKEKKKFFNKMNKKYLESIQTRSPKRSDNKHINFALNKTEVQVFNKNKKIKE